MSTRNIDKVDLLLSKLDNNLLISSEKNVATVNSFKIGFSRLERGRCLNRIRQNMLHGLRI